LTNVDGSVIIEGNLINRSRNDGIGVVANMDLTIVGNFIIHNSNGIKCYNSGANMVIRNNTITNNGRGITGTGYSLIERNLIANNSVGLDLTSEVTVQNNTITNIYNVAIRLTSCSSATIKYNNIENYGENSIYLVDTFGDVDVTNNWWGTTNTQTINLTIHDYKYDLDLGSVDFIPFLNEPNSEATSSIIPEFPSWVILPLFLVAVFGVVVVRKRLFC
jgi:hypothetical protein